MSQIPIEPQQDDDLPDIERLLDQVFGPDRFAKASYQYRKDVDPLADLSFVMRDQGRLIASLRFWPVRIVTKDRRSSDALLLGPIAVDQAYQGQGLGIRLMNYGLNQATDAGHEYVILVGDEPYYKRIGFSHTAAEGLMMPGQQDVARLLARSLGQASLENISGTIEPVKF